MLRLIIAALLAPAALSGAGSVVATVSIGPAGVRDRRARALPLRRQLRAGTLARVDPATNRVVGRVTGLGTACGLGAGANAIWVEDYRGNEIVRVGLKRFRVAKRIHVGRQPWDVTFAFGAAWATNSGDGTVSRIDPKRNAVVATLHLGGLPACIRADAHALWVGGENSSIYRIDPATNAVRTIPVAGSRSTLCVDPQPDGIWVVNNYDNTVTVLDPSTYAPVRTIDVPDRPTDAVRGADGTEWVASRIGGTVTRIDPATGAVVDTISTGGAPFVVRAGFGDVWTADFSGPSLWRLHAAP